MVQRRVFDSVTVSWSLSPGVPSEPIKAAPPQLVDGRFEIDDGLTLIDSA